MPATTGHAIRRSVVLRRDEAIEGQLGTVVIIPVEVRLRPVDGRVRELVGTVEVDRIAGEALVDIAARTDDDACTHHTSRAVVDQIMYELWGSAPRRYRWRRSVDGPTQRYQAIAQLRL